MLMPTSFSSFDKIERNDKTYFKEHENQQDWKKTAKELSNVSHPTKCANLHQNRKAREDNTCRKFFSRSSRFISDLIKLLLMLNKKSIVLCSL